MTTPNFPTPQAEALNMVPRQMASLYGFIPVSLEEGVLTLAAATDANVALLDEGKDDLESFLGLRVQYVRSFTSAQINAALTQNYGPDEEAMDEALDVISDFGFLDEE